MTAPERGAHGVVFAAVGMAVCLAIYAAQHALLAYGPAMRNWMLAHPMQIAIAAYGALLLIAVWGLWEQEP